MSSCLLWPHWSCAGENSSFSSYNWQLLEESANRRWQTRRKHNCNNTDMLFTFHYLKIILLEKKSSWGKLREKLRKETCARKLLPLSTWKPTPFPSLHGRSRRTRGRAGLTRAGGEAAPARPPAPGSLLSRGARAARPGRGWTWAPRAADTRESVNAVTSPPVSAAQQEMLSASPLPARRKWGSCSCSRCAGPDLVSGLRRRRLPRGQGTLRRHRLCQGSLCRACLGTPLCWKGREIGRHRPWGRPRHLHHREPRSAGPEALGRIVLNNAGCRGPERTCSLPWQNVPSFFLQSPKGNLLFHPTSVTFLLCCGSKDRMFSAKHKRRALYTLRDRIITRKHSIYDFHRCYLGRESYLKKCLWSCEFRNSTVALDLLCSNYRCRFFLFLFFFTIFLLFFFLL